jgi:hypothetical protein
MHGREASRQATTGSADKQAVRRQLRPSVPFAAHCKHVACRQPAGVQSHCCMMPAGSKVGESSLPQPPHASDDRPLLSPGIVPASVGIRVLHRLAQACETRSEPQQDRHRRARHTPSDQRVACLHKATGRPLWRSALSNAVQGTVHQPPSSLPSHSYCSPQLRGSCSSKVARLNCGLVLRSAHGCQKQPVEVSMCLLEMHRS